MFSKLRGAVSKAKAAVQETAQAVKEKASETLQASVLGASLMIPVVPMQTDPVPTLAIDANVVQTGLFTGANMMLVALGSIVFLLIGFQFGGSILRAVASYIGSWRF